MRSAYSKRERVSVDFSDDPGRTKQSMRDECDINGIMRKFEKTGVVSHVSRYGGRYGFAPAIDLREALEVVAEADKMFKALPAKARRRFGNDPAEFLEFVQDPANIAEAAELGLIVLEKPAEEPVVEPVVPA